MQSTRTTLLRRAARCRACNYEIVTEEAGSCPCSRPCLKCRAPTERLKVLRRGTASVDRIRRTSRRPEGRSGARGKAQYDSTARDCQSRTWSGQLSIRCLLLCGVPTACPRIDLNIALPEVVIQHRQ